MYSLAKVDSGKGDEASLLTGGDFAGLTATFSSKGTLLPVPEHLIPESLLEWGQVPSCLEVIVSEMIVSSTEGTMERQTVNIYPAVGCGVDNLETSKTIDHIHWTVKAASDTVVAMDNELNNNKIRTETIFALPSNHRLRIIIDLLQNQIQSPIRVNLERRTSIASTRGMISDGGGLDGRTVSRLLGDELNSGTRFSDEMVEQIDDGSIRLPRGLMIASDESSLIIRYENQTITRRYKEGRTVEIEVL